ncbi:MAG: penicillin-binding transpeptidase domain-containing protein, partial [Anaerolineales bacterium]
LGLAEVGDVLGRTALQEAALAFGLGEAPTEDLVSSHPTATERILEGTDLSQVGIGQGRLLVSPLQIARAFGALAAGGFLPSPRLILEVESPSGDWLPWGRTEEPVAAVPPEIATAILQLLARDPLGNGGYGAYAIAGPTGDRVAWFVAIAKQGRTPLIVLAVLEDGTTEAAGEIALAVLGLEGSPSPP